MVKVSLSLHWESLSVRFRWKKQKKHHASMENEDIMATIRSEETGFRLFNKLPFEIREIIWQLALPDARIFRVKDQAVRSHSITLMEYRHPPPSILQVCGEARTAALKCGDSKFGRLGSSIGSLWFNNDKDILFFPYDRESDESDIEDPNDIMNRYVQSNIVFRGIRRVAIDEECEPDCDVLQNILDVIPAFDVLYIAVAHVVSGSGKDLKSYPLQAQDVFRPLMDEHEDDDDIEDIDVIEDAEKWRCDRVAERVRKIWAEEVLVDRPLTVHGIEIFERQE